MDRVTNDEEIQRADQEVEVAADEEEVQQDPVGAAPVAGDGPDAEEDEEEEEPGKCANDVISELLNSELMQGKSIAAKGLGSFATAFTALSSFMAPSPAKGKSPTPIQSVIERIPRDERIRMSAQWKNSELIIRSIIEDLKTSKKSPTTDRPVLRGTFAMNHSQNLEGAKLVIARGTITGRIPHEWIRPSSFTACYLEHQLQLHKGDTQEVLQDMLVGGILLDLMLNPQQEMKDLQAELLRTHALSDTTQEFIANFTQAMMTHPKTFNCIQNSFEGKEMKDIFGEEGNEQQVHEAASRHPIWIITTIIFMLATYLAHPDGMEGSTESLFAIITHLCKDYKGLQELAYLNPVVMRGISTVMKIQFDNDHIQSFGVNSFLYVQNRLTFVVLGALAVFLQGAGIGASLPIDHVQLAIRAIVRSCNETGARTTHAPKAKSADMQRVTQDSFHTAKESVLMLSSAFLKSRAQTARGGSGGAITFTKPEEQALQKLVHRLYIAALFLTCTGKTGVNKKAFDGSQNTSVAITAEVLEEIKTGTPASDRHIIPSKYTAPAPADAGVVAAGGAAYDPVHYTDIFLSLMTSLKNVPCTSVFSAVIPNTIRRIEAAAASSAGKRRGGFEGDGAPAKRTKGFSFGFS